MIEIAASPEAVWKAISKADEIMRWFAPQAKVGLARMAPWWAARFWLSWGPGVEGTGRIEIWEPGKHLRTVMQRQGAYDVCGTNAGSAV